MTAHALMLVDKPTFFRFIATAGEGARYEFVRGWIMQQQAGGTLRHVNIARRISQIVERQLAPEQWVVNSGSDRGVDTPATVRFPDVVVEPMGEPEDSLATRRPALVVEVLSPSSEERDLTAKPVEYTGLPTLHAYIVASQTDPLVYVWQRGGDASFPIGPATLQGRDQVIQIPTLAVAISLAEVYRGIGA